MAIALLCGYAAALLLVSRRFGGNAGADAFFVNNRASGASGVAMSVIVSCVGASATMGAAGMAFHVGTPAFWWLGAGAAGLTVLAFLLAARVRRTECFTMPEMSATLLGGGSRPLMACVIVVAWTAILAAQFTAMETLLRSFTGWPTAWCLAAGFALIAFHTCGGQAAIIRTDRLQFYLLLGGLALLLIGLCRANPGWTAAVNIEAVNSRFTAGDLLRYAFVVGGNYVVCPMLFGRMYSARDAATARRGALLGALGLAVCSAVIVAVGLAARGLVEADVPADAVLARALEQGLPPWLGALATLALLSAVVSSADSCLVTSSAVLCFDLIRSDRPMTGRLCVLVLGAAGLGLTFLGKDILGYLLMAYDIYVAGVVLPVFVALLYNPRDVRRPWFCLMAIAGGGALGAAANWGGPVYSYVGMAFSLVFTLLGLAGSPQGETGQIRK